jgi:SAM-dependent methyltransferase
MKRKICTYCKNKKLIKKKVSSYTRCKIGFFYFCKICNIYINLKKIDNLYKHKKNTNYNFNKNFFFFLKIIILNFFIFKLRKFLKYKRNILDYGCGSGELANCLANYFPDKKIYTSDIFKLDKSFIPKIKKHYLLNENLIYKKKFDSIILRHVLEHILNIRNFLKKIKRLLKNNGSVLIIEVPNINSVWKKIMNFYWPGFFYPYHHYVFSEKFLQVELRRANYTIINIKKLHPPIFGTFFLNFNIPIGFCKILAILFYPLQYFISLILNSSESILWVVKKND